MKEIPQNLSPQWFSLRLNRIIKSFDIHHSELMKAAGIKDESFLEPYLSGSSLQITDTQKKLYQACADIIAVNLNTEILDAGINYEYIANTLNVSRTTIDNWLNRYNEASSPFKQFDRIKAVIEGSQYYMGFKHLSDEEFAKFFDKNNDSTFGKLWKKNGLSIEKIYNDLGLTKNDISLIRNEQLHLSAGRQYEILSKAYDMCIDYTCRYYEGFEEIGKKLYHLLNLQYHEDIITRFSDLIMSLKEMLRFNIDKKYSSLKEKYSEEEFTLSQMSLYFILNNNTFYWDIKEKALILDRIFQTEEWKRIEKSFKSFLEKDPSEQKKDNYVLHFYSEYFPLYDVYCNLKNINDGLEEKKWEERLKDLSSDFKQYPLETQKIILSHADVFLDIDFNKYFTGIDISSYCNLSLSDSDNNEYSSINSNIFYYMDHLIDLFKELSIQSKHRVIEEFSRSFSIHLNSSNSEFKYLTQCCDMIVLTMEAPLPDTDSSRPKPADYISIKKTDRKFRRYYDKNKIRKRLQYTSLEWNFMALIALMMNRMGNLSFLERDLKLLQKSEQNCRPKDDD